MGSTIGVFIDMAKREIRYMLDGAPVAVVHRAADSSLTWEEGVLVAASFAANEGATLEFGYNSPSVTSGKHQRNWSDRELVMVKTDAQMGI